MSVASTQNEDYWENLHVGQDDINHLYGILLEKEEPMSIDEMALELVRYRAGREQATHNLPPDAGTVYRPDRQYQAGDRLVFPALSNATGEVVGLRQGANPLDGKFEVIMVEMSDQTSLELASGLQSPHSLSGDRPSETVQQDVGELTPEQQFIEFGGIVADVLEEALEQHDDLVSLAGYWFAKSLLADVNEGHLNLSEAVLDMNDGGPMTTPAILEQLGLLTDVNDLLAEFSMNYGLLKDPRFDEVGPAGHVWWFLTRLEPEHVRTPPPRLEYQPIAFEMGLLSEEQRELELEIGDEHSPPPRHIKASLAESATITLTYHHHRAGTLPLSIQLRRMFPMAYSAERIRFTLVDAESSEEFPAWVVRSGGYVYGLGDWLAHHDIPVGGFLAVERTEDPGRVLIDFSRRKPRKDWVRTALVENKRLKFENRQWTFQCDYDELMVVAVPDPDRVDLLWKQLGESGYPLDRLVADIARELVVFNPQSNVHAKTVYSAVNLVRRCPPGPILAVLSDTDRFEAMGGHYFRLRDHAQN